MWFTRSRLTHHAFSFINEVFSFIDFTSENITTRSRAHTHTHTHTQTHTHTVAPLCARVRA